MEVWGFEPQTYGLQSRRSSQLSYTPSRVQNGEGKEGSGGGILSHRKEVIQPHLPVRLPCYDFTPLTRRTFGGVPPRRLDYRLRVPPTRVV
jgi:hypothetical protein